MKSYLSKLSVLLLGAMFAVVGCQDYDEDIRKINEQLSADVTDLNSLIDELEDELAELEKLAATHATKEELDALKTQLQGDLANVKKALEDAYKAADAVLKAGYENADAALKAELEKKIEDAKKAAEEALDQRSVILENMINSVQSEVNGVYEFIEMTLMPALDAAHNNLDNKITKVAGDLATAITDLTAKDAALESKLNEAIGRIDKNAADIIALQGELKKANDAVKKAQEDILKNAADIEAEKQAREQAVAALKTAYEAKVAQLEADLLANVAALNAEKAAREAADAALKAEYAAADAALKTALQSAINSNASAISTLQAKVATLESKVTELQTKVDQLLSKVAANEASITELGKQIAAIEASIEEALANLENKVNEVATALRSVVLVPDTIFNGTKAVKFFRQDGKNVLKTFATVSYRFNPSNFDASTATYEIVAEQVEVMTRGIIAEGPAIEIVGTPVQEGDKVTFELERGEGAGNMFALKATLADGTTIYSEYAAIIDEATYAVATATASFEVERLAFAFPDLSSISAIIEYVQSLGQTVEDFSTTIEAINNAIAAIQENDVVSALSHLVQIPGLQKEKAVIEGVGTYRVQVETLDAAEIIESLKNAQSIDEIRKIITDLLTQAEGLGEAGSAIIEGLNGAIGGSGLNELLGQYDNLKDFQLPELVLTYEQAVAQLDQYQTELDNARAEFQALKDEMDAIIAALDEATQAEVAALQAELDAFNAEYAELEAQYETAGALDKIKIGAEMATLKTKIAAKEAAIIAKAGSEYFNVRADLFLKESAVNTAELLLKGARQAVDLADQAVKKAEENLAKLETEILNKVKDYIFNNTELGKYLTELENALGEQAWEAKKTVAAGTAQLFAIDALIADLIQNYNAANQKVVDDFANSLFGRVAFLIQTKEAEEAFELIGLSELYTVVKQLPDLLTIIIKYYPSGVDLTNFTNFNEFGTTFSDYLTSLIPETTVEWELDYYLAQ